MFPDSNAHHKSVTPLKTARRATVRGEVELTTTLSGAFTLLGESCSREREEEATQPKRSW